jgi:hypothetical protein
MRHLRNTAVLGLALALLAGCGGSGPGKLPEGQGGTPTGKQGLESLVEVLKHFEAEKKSPPAKLADVEKVESLYPGAFVSLTRGDIVYVWGEPLNASGGGKVLAYEKEALTGGGYVLMQDGTIKSMSAGEAKAAPKATK